MKQNKIIFIAMIFGLAVKAHEEPACVPSVKEIPLDEISALGFSGQNLLDNVAKHHPNQQEWKWDYKDTATVLHVGVQPFNDTALYVNEALEMEDGTTVCIAHLEVYVTVTFTTDDGAFNESWTTTLYDWEASFNRPGFAPGDEAAISHFFTQDELKGNFYDDASFHKDTVFSLNIYFHKDFGMRAGLFGYALGENENDVDFVDGGHTLNFWDPATNN